MTLVLRWRIPARAITARWRGPEGMRDAFVRNPTGPLAVLVGPPGPPAGVTDFSPYIHSQASASDEWIVNHNLGWNPMVTVLSPGGKEVEAEIVHMSVNQTRIYFNQPFTGSATMR